MNKSHAILGVGTPILDHILHIDPSYLSSLSGEPYGMELISYEEMIALIENSGAIPRQIAGGSCCNAIKGLAALGHACAITGKVGKGPTGEKVMEDLAGFNVAPLVCFSNLPTAHAACLITPNGKRTCRTFMGAGGEMEPKDLNPEHFQGVKLVHIEGYSLLSAGLTYQAMEYAKQAGATISFDVGSFEIIENYRDLLISLIQKYVSILFANEGEAEALTGKGAKEGCQQLSKLSELAIVMMGDKGCWTGSPEGLSHHPAFPVAPIDTTGAGDLFASGFLHGLLTRQPIEACARYGAITGAAVVQQVGAEIPSTLWSEVTERMGVC